MVSFSQAKIPGDQSADVAAPVKERPILFSGPMVRALLDGRKTQTRRVVKRTPLEWLDGAGFTPEFVADPANGLCPYGKPGDRLYVRETWGLNHYQYERGPIPKTRPADLEDQYLAYQATEDDTEIRNELRWRPSIHMPRWAVRIVLEVTEVRIERLLDCSEADAEAEGLEWVVPGMWSVARHLPIIGEDARKVYFELWDYINGKGAADLNPWVWAVSFRVLTVSGEVEADALGTEPSGEVNQNPEQLQ